MQNIWKTVSFVLAAMLVGSLITGVVMSVPHSLQNEATAQDRGPAAAMVPQGNTTIAEGLSTSFHNVAATLRPSVVSISTQQTRIIRRGLPPGFRAPRGLENGGGQEELRQQSTGSGSGVIVRSDGYILTNNHVIQDADALLVEFSDGRTAPGKVIGTDPETDLAVVKVELNNLQAVRFGDSDAIRVGDWVLAIGSPFGLDHTVTAGIISGKNRDQDIIGKNGEGFEDFLQTDAAINPGNSGGALVNLRGELVGINTAILSKSGTSAGIGFAIPVSLAQPVLSSIIETGVVRRGFLGAQVADVTPMHVKDLKLAVTSGALMIGVHEGQPAAKAGLRPGDVVTAIDGKAVSSGTEVRNYVAGRLPGTVVVMDVNRDGQTLKLSVNLQERTSAAMARLKSGEIMGAVLMPVDQEIGAQYGYRNVNSGLVVTEVKPDGDADEAGLQVGDIIESAAGVALTEVDQFNSILDQGEKRQQAVRVSVRRGNSRMLMIVRP